MQVYPNERVALFIDGPNIHATMKTLGFDIDYKKLLSLFRTKGRLIRALYYTTVLADNEFSTVRPLIDWLEYNGFTLVTKPAKEFIDDDGRRRIKGGIAVALAVDVMCLSNDIDHAVIFSGDGDFSALLAAMKRQGKRVSVISTLMSKPPMISDDLRRQADQFIDLADLRSMIGRTSEARREVDTAESPRVDSGRAKSALTVETRTRPRVSTK